MIEVSDATRARIRALCSQGDWEDVERILLTRCGDNLPVVEATYAELAERIRFAVLKLSNGQRAELEHQIALARMDWRDTLVAAGFGHSLTAHPDWMP